MRTIIYKYGLCLRAQPFFNSKFKIQDLGFEIQNLG